ncbi:MAG: AAA family ATPase [Deltaproteobacteria bacterium]|nr:AAA family ATPase [Deltaproteobacteria bacterium]
MRLLDSVQESSIVVVLGDGGVGKTTVASALAMLAAARGRRVLAVTVDPSNRLKTAMGLTGRPGEEEPVDLGGLPVAETGGSLHAMVLDAATEMDRLVDRLLPTPEARRRITDNVFYRKAAATMAGTHEYMAMERLLEALESGRYDLVVLDTPPERHALDFLDAPARLDGLLSSDVFRLFVTASAGLGRIGLGALRWRSVILKGISKFAGEETFLAILDFVLAFQPLFEGFRQRAARVGSWFTGPDCSTLIVCRPGPQCAREVCSTLNALRGRGIEPAAVVANRVRFWPPSGSDARTARPVTASTLRKTLESNPALSLHDPATIERLAARTLDLAGSYRELAKEDRGHMESLAASTGPVALYEIPLLKGEVRDPATLALFAAVVEQAVSGDLA